MQLIISHPSASLNVSAYAAITIAKTVALYGRSNFISRVNAIFLSEQHTLPVHKEVVSWSVARTSPWKEILLPTLLHIFMTVCYALWPKEFWLTYVPQCLPLHMFYAHTSLPRYQTAAWEEGQCMKHWVIMLTGAHDVFLVLVYPEMRQLLFHKAISLWNVVTWWRSKIFN